MKFKWLSICIVILLLLTSCSSEYEIKPGEQSDFAVAEDGAKIIAPEYVSTKKLNAVQQPSSFFMREAHISNEKEQTIYLIYKSGAEAYMNMLRDLGYEMFYEDLGYVYNEYAFVLPENGKTTGEHGAGYDVYVKHVYASSYTVKHDWLEVLIDTETTCYDDLGLRMNPEDAVEISDNYYANDAFLYKKGKYYNASDGKLSVKAGVIEDTLYMYTKPFASSMYGYYGKTGLCSVRINGENYGECKALICDYPDFDGGNTDMLVVYGKSGELLKITWEHKQFKVGEMYNLADVLGDSYCRFEFNYDYNEFEEGSLLRAFIRPLWIDRTAKSESVMYFYAEFENSDGEQYTVEGLAAAPFCLVENSEKYSSESSSSSGGSSGSWDHDSKDPFVPEHSKLNCLTCKGDGKCNSCGGSGVDYYGTAKTKCNTCRGSGNCKSCGGSGKR